MGRAAPESRGRAVSRLIAETYEIQEEIGAGGIGVVYRGWHTRLDKPVVLKAERRMLKARIGELRREVNMLKQLSHTYIPQVYDFITEEDTVYTVMDYIEGKSMAELLREGGWAPSQAEIIGWARQLLDALCYLHGQPPYGILHGDIKPANIMLTPRGDIRLIDFNIALALGEEGAVQVGHSRGYASPEHYGIDYSTRRGRSTQPSGAGAAVLLDVRSDIYCLGATLYHLLTGATPAENARDVVPIRSANVSPAVADIVRKAMTPDPDERFQTAREMLDAFESLYDNDPRVRRYQQWVRVTAAILGAILLIGGASAFTGLRQMERVQAAEAEAARLAEERERTAKQALSKITQAEAACQQGDMAQAVSLSREALLLHTVYDARAQRALTEALGVYDLSANFRPHRRIDLPGEPGKAILSPEGTRAGTITGGQLLVFDTESGEQLASLPAEDSALANLVFSGEDVVIYAGEGGLRAYDLSRKQELWSGGRATAVALSADGTAVAAAYHGDSAATIDDAATGAVRQTVDFQGNALHALFNDAFVDPDSDMFQLNGDGSMLAVGFSDSGALWIYDLQDRSGDIQIYGQSEINWFEGGFHGPYLAFTGWDGTESSFAIIDTAALIQTGGYAQPIKFRVQADESGVYLSAGRLLARMDPAAFTDTEMAYGNSYITAAAVDGGRNTALIATEDGTLSIFEAGGNCLGVWENQEPGRFLDIAGNFALAASSDQPVLYLRKRADRQKELLLTYDSACGHNEARLSGDGKTVMLFRYDRFYVLDADGGEVLADVEIPLSEGDQVYDQQFRRDERGSRLEVVCYSGRTLTYSAADGSLLMEKYGTPPDGSLFEEFLTKRLRIERALHGVPAVYDRATGERIGQLKPEDYLTYVTEVGEYVMTEYVSSQTGERYGLLLNENLEILAELPELCDVLADGRLVFDDGKGNLRQSQMYSVEELLELAERY